MGPVFQVEAVARLVANVIHDLLQVAPRLVENAQLAVRSRAVLQDPVYPLDLLAGAQLVHDVVHELEHLSREVAEGHLDFLAAIDQFPVDSPAARAPLVLEDQRAAVTPPAQVLDTQFVELHADRLDQRRDRYRLVHAHRNVADAELDRLEEGVRAEIPPDLLAVVDAVRLDHDACKLVEVRGPL